MKDKKKDKDYTKEIDFNKAVSLSELSEERQREVQGYGNLSNIDKGKINKRIKGTAVSKSDISKAEITKRILEDESLDEILDPIDPIKFGVMTTKLYGMFSMSKTDENQAKAYKIYSRLQRYASLLNEYIITWGNYMELPVKFARDSDFAEDAREVLNCIEEYMKIEFEPIGGYDYWEGMKVRIHSNDLNRIMKKRGITSKTYSKSILKRMSKESLVKLSWSEYTGRSKYSGQHMINQDTLVINRETYEELKYFYTQI